MSGHADPPRVEDGRWHCPIDVARYDRNPVLDPHERVELALMTRYLTARNRHGVQRSACVLERLIRPIEDVLVVTRAPKGLRYDVVNLLVREMRQRQSAFWGWTRDTWTDVEAFNKPSSPQRHARHHVIAVAYFLNGYTDLHLHSGAYQYAYSLAVKIFGKPAVDASIERLCAELRAWGYTGAWLTRETPRALASVLLVNGSPHLEDLTAAVLERVRKGSLRPYLKRTFLALSTGLASLGILPEPLARDLKDGERFGHPDPLTGISPAWSAWCTRWLDTSTLNPTTRRSVFHLILRAGRWLSLVHPDVTGPEQWNRELAAAYVAAVDRLTIGQWTVAAQRPVGEATRSVSAGYKQQHLYAVSTFLQDCQEWGWIPRRFDPRRCFTTPRAIRAQIAPNPRVIQDDIWAKLLWAGLNLRAEDLPRGLWTDQGTRPNAARRPWYPLEMLRAIVLVWLFGGIRRDELVRLRLGCIRWQREDVGVVGSADALHRNAVCFLSIPTNKTGTAFAKPVDAVVGEAIGCWEHARPAQPPVVDRRTGEIVHYLFSYRARRVGQDYINGTIIPMLCRKAGVPEQDARGNITSHRARSTIASQLFNAKEPLSLFELQAWLGHRTPASTQHYARITPTKLAQAYAEAGYFGRNLRMIEVLVDQDAIKDGAAAAGEPWRFYDLGHGYCTYDFFDQCPHRMACAKCAFYVPKGSSKAQVLEAKAGLQRMLEEIPLTDEERAAVEDGVVAYDKLLTKLADVPTPAGPTPRQLAAHKRAELAVIDVSTGERTE